MTDPLKCPTCESPEPRLHPATQAEGEVTHICPDPFHRSASDREPRFEPGWLQEQVARSVASLDRLPEGLRRSIRGDRS